MRNLFLKRNFNFKISKNDAINNLLINNYKSCKNFFYLYLIHLRKKGIDVLIFQISLCKYHSRL